MRTWLIAKRKKLALSQYQIAKIVNISQPSYCNIENGSRNPSVITAMKIADALGFDWTLFYEEKAG